MLSKKDNLNTDYFIFCGYDITL